MKRSLILSALLLPALLLAAACGGTSAQERTPPASNQPQGIAVSGHGQVSGKPDVAILTLGVVAERQTVKQARDDAAAKMQAVIDAVKQAGVADKDIQTTNFNIMPQYDYNNGRSTLRGFQVTNMVTFKVRNIDSTGDVIDAVVAAGGDDTQGQSLTFTIDDPTALKAQARREAMADARSKAEVLADAGGVSLGAPFSISENVNVPQYLYPGTMDSLKAAAAGPATPIETGQMDVSVDVTVTYQIG